MLVRLGKSHSLPQLSGWVLRCCGPAGAANEDEPFDAVVDDDDVARLDPGAVPLTQKSSFQSMSRQLSPKNARKGCHGEMPQIRSRGKKGKMSSATKADGTMAWP